MADSEIRVLPQHRTGNARRRPRASASVRSTIHIHGRAMSAEAAWVIATNDSQAFRTDVTSGTHTTIVDEPVSLGGNDLGPTPYDSLLGAIASCTSMTVLMYVNRKRWPHVSVSVPFRSALPDAADCLA